MEESIRKTISEIDILSVPCRRCNSIAGVGCKNKERLPLTYELNSNELAFHRERVMDSWSKHSTQRMGNKIDSFQKAMIVYYAFVHMANSVAANSQKIFGKEMSSIDIQAFFVMHATKELKLDRVI